MVDDGPYYGAPPRNAGNFQRHTVRTSEKPPKRRGGVLRRIIGLILVLLALYILFTSPLLPLIMNNVGPYRVYPEEATFTIQRTITLSGSGAYTVDFAEPNNISNAQEVKKVVFDPYPERSERYGRLWDVWNGDLGALNRRDTITIQYTLHTYTLVWNMEGSGSVYSIPQDIRDQYTSDEWTLIPADTPLGTSDRDGDGQPDVMMEPSAPAISELAHQLTDDKPEVYAKAKAIYDYMHKNFKYSTPAQMQQVQEEYGGLPKHSLATLRDGWGDCDDQSMLYISLLRAVGVPARIEMGMLYDQQNDEWGGHAWAQVYIAQQDGTGGWYNVDIVNSQFLFRDCNRMSTWIDDGNAEHLDDYYHIFRGAGTVNFDESDTSISYTSSGQIKVSSDMSTDSLPGFEAVLVPIAVSVALFLRKKKR